MQDNINKRRVAALVALITMFNLSGCTSEKKEVTSEVSTNEQIETLSRKSRSMLKEFENNNYESYSNNGNNYYYYCCNLEDVINVCYKASKEEDYHKINEYLNILGKLIIKNKIGMTLYEDGYKDLNNISIKIDNDLEITYSYKKAILGNIYLSFDDIEKFNDYINKTENYEIENQNEMNEIIKFYEEIMNYSGNITYTSNDININLNKTEKVKKLTK